MKRLAMTIASAATGTSFDGYLPKTHGAFVALIVKVKIPDVTGTPTATLTVYDPDGDAVYTKASIAENIVTIDDAKKIPVSPNAKVNLTFTSAPGVANHTIVFYGP